MTPLDVGAWASALELVSVFLDRRGVTCHRDRISGSGYGTLRQLLYGTSASYAVLFFAFANAFVIDGCPRCADALQTWAILASAPLAYTAVFRAVAGFSLIVILVDSLLLGSVALRLHRHLLQSELLARHEERMRFREQLASNVLTIADIRRATSTTPAQRIAADALKLQSVVRYGREALDQHECPICLESFNVIEEITRATCGHVFHSDCLGRALERNLTCPLCRGHLAQELDIDLEALAPPPPPPQTAHGRQDRLRPQASVFGGELV
eukprot:CAMPEP_0170279744 /NCGR_PEP_ID=MMETSP0116_2-20130129/39884_1 /TAXON_ID=400756 /ORGANISM="Durinskia baltica, Strain CSIRO CS-38" /LENGTH=268 /DNA_ID=CAMNT_0010531071 /DNA_START=120 /DNA_END=926 /DNA_ORIENTATION=-